jgi:regulatory protein
MVRRGRTGRGWDAAPPRAATGRPARPTRRVGAPRPRADGEADPGSHPIQDSRPAQDPAERAREICLQQLGIRPRTRAELAETLRARGIADEVATEVLQRYGEVGLIDDEAFARAWVSSRHHGKGLARRALASELRRKGVGSDAVSGALDELDPATEEQTARDLVARRLRSERAGNPEATFRRLVGLLARKGYPPGLAFRVVRDAIAERKEMAEFADAVDVDALAEAADAETAYGATAGMDGDGAGSDAQGKRSATPDG